MLEGCIGVGRDGVVVDGVHNGAIADALDLESTHLFVHVKVLNVALSGVRFYSSRQSIIAWIFGI